MAVSVVDIKLKASCAKVLLHFVKHEIQYIGEFCSSIFPRIIITPVIVHVYSSDNRARMSSTTEIDYKIYGKKVAPVSE